ncbi:MAG: AAA family ATPase [Deltaproteobacteria bacterium]|nr:AAA family ATPase [Deltaproteobacteria bacterium]
MRRFVDLQLAGWAKSVRRKPLIVRGARQVGKTYSIKELGRQSFERTVTVDLERNRDWHRVFAGNLDARQMCTGEPWRSNSSARSWSSRRAPSCTTGPARRAGARPK